MFDTDGALLGFALGCDEGWDEGLPNKLGDSLGFVLGCDEGWDDGWLDVLGLLLGTGLRLVRLLLLLLLLLVPLLRELVFFRDPGGGFSATAPTVDGMVSAGS